MSTSKRKAPKTVIDKIVAVLLDLKTPGGSSRQAIVKGLKSTFNYENPTALRTALKNGVASGVLAQDGQKFWPAAHPPPDLPAEETVQVEELVPGKGEAAASGSECTMAYKGTLLNGTQFDASKKFKFTLGAGEVIKGWEKGVAGMKVGGKRKLTVPPKLGYGKRGSPPEIPPDSTLVFEIHLLAVK